MASHGAGDVEPVEPVEPGEPGASDESDVIEVGPSRQALLAWRRWRRTRPFWGGLLIILGGAEMLLSEQAPLPIIIHVGIQGLAGYLVPVVLVLCGLLLWLSPVQQAFYSVLAVVLALGSWITSNLGGFFIGLMLGVIGGALAFAWTRGEEPVPPVRPQWRRPSKTPSKGLSLIFTDEEADAEYQDAERPEREPSAHGDDGGAASGGGRTGSSLLAISAVPVVLFALVVLPRLGPLAGEATSAAALTASPSAAQSLGSTPSPTGTASSAPTPSGSPSLSPSPSPTPTPTVSPGPSHSPWPRPPRRGARPPAIAAAAVSSIAAASATITGLAFDGVANVRTSTGVVPMLVFSMASMMLSGDTLRGGEPGGRSLDAVSSLLGLTGHVLLYATEITGEVDGAKVTFTPQSPPTKISSDMTFTDMIMDQPYATADALQVAGLQLTIARG